MEIHALKITLTESDLNDLARRHLPESQPVEELSVRLTPEGVLVQGVYPLFVNVRFEVLWELAIRGQKLHARLARFNALGLPGGVFKSTILKLIADAARKHHWVQIDEHAVLVDVDQFLAANGLPARTNFCAITCQSGLLLLEARSAGEDSA